MGTKTIAVILALSAALVAERLVAELLPLPIRAALAFIVCAGGYYYGYPLLKRLKEGDF